MKKQELIKIIELVVRKEVKKQVNEIFIKEGIKSLTRSSNLVETKDNNSISLKESLSQKELVSPPSKPKPKKEVRYTENESLNKILNETANGKPTEEWPTMGGGTYDTSKMAEAMGYGNLPGGGSKEVKREIAAVQTMKDAGVSTEQVGEDVVNALTRDYSGVMKAIEKKKQGFRP
jgi:hypothetical protein|tara:strand:+ start:3102 stop:3629 length:528 start_codon:yes stop_codon:yes gene_type:complete